MFNIVYKYLVINKQVHIPGIGLFVVEPLPARFNLSGEVLHAPGSTILFKHTELTYDRHFLEFVSKELNTEKIETLSLFYEFVSGLKKEVETNKTVELPGIGVLENNNNGSLHFIPAALFTDYFPSVNLIALNGQYAWQTRESEQSASPLVSESNLHKRIAKKPRWLLAAIVLGALGLIAIAYYYYSEVPG